VDRILTPAVRQNLPIDALRGLMNEFGAALGNVYLINLGLAVTPLADPPGAPALSEP
jgi:hypothetical protein